ncbi:MAG: hypothetical protein IPG04_40365 [Polyangiaceae bacterium]|nr:hypothetical protein [Polyangiaceae bacterium]
MRSVAMPLPFVELEAELLGELGRLALAEDQVLRRQRLAARERHLELLAVARDGVDVRLAQRGADRGGLPARDLLEVRAEHLRDAEVVLEQRPVHGRLVLAEDDDLELVLRKE